jgi:acyl carrier protein
VDILFSRNKNDEMATNPEILSQLLEILKPFTKEGQQLREETKLVAELGLDSLQVMQVLLKIEDHFDISIPLNNLPTIQTIQELVLEIETLVKA